jgi:transposase
MDKIYARKPGAGRKPKDSRLVFETIVYVLRTGCQWKALPEERFGSANAIHARFLEWEKAGFSMHSGEQGWPNTMNT